MTDFRPASKARGSLRVRARPVTPLPARGRLRRAFKSILRAALMPLTGIVAAFERRLRRFADAPDTAAWPYPEQPRTALVVRLDLLGDCLLTLPAVAALKQRHPGLRVTFLAARGSAELLARASSVDEVIECDLADLTHLKALANPGKWGTAVGLLAQLRRARFDIAVSAYGPLARAVVALSLARHRIADGTGLPAVERDRRIAAGEHEIDHLLELVTGSPHPPQGCLQRPRARDPSPVADAVILCPGTRSGSAKAWPAAAWRELAEALGKRGFAPVVVGGPADASLAEAICGPEPAALNLAGQLSIAQLHELICRARLVVGVDSMPMHLASLAGTPTLGLFGPTDPRRYRPRGRGRAISLGIGCSPCYDQRAPPECPFGDQACMRWLEPGRVLAAALQVADG